jgi:hypothetical protein
MLSRNAEYRELSKVLTMLLKCYKLHSMNVNSLRGSISEDMNMKLCPDLNSDTDDCYYDIRLLSCDKYFPETHVA